MISIVTHSCERQLHRGYAHAAQAQRLSLRQAPRPDVLILINGVTAVPNQADAVESVKDTIIDSIALAYDTYEYSDTTRITYAS